MKKSIYLFVLFISIFFNSCSRDDTSEINKISPPAWIKGVWVEDFLKQDQFTFTDDDIIITSAGASTSLKPIAEQGNYSQTSSNTEFSYSINFSSTRFTYKFKKVSNTKIIGDLGTGENEADWAEFIKQK